MTVQDVRGRLLRVSDELVQESTEWHARLASAGRDIFPGSPPPSATTAQLLAHGRGWTEIGLVSTALEAMRRTDVDLITMFSQAAIDDIHDDAVADLDLWRERRELMAADTVEQLDLAEKALGGPQR